MNKDQMEILSQLMLPDAIIKIEKKRKEIIK